MCLPAIKSGNVRFASRQELMRIELAQATSSPHRENSFASRQALMRIELAQATSSPHGENSFESDEHFESIVLQNLFNTIMALPPEQELDYRPVATKLPSLASWNDDSDEDFLQNHPMTRDELRKGRHALPSPPTTPPSRRPQHRGRSYCRSNKSRLTLISVH